MQWSHHPLKDKPWWQSLFLIGTILLFAAIVFVTMSGDIILSVASLVILFLAMSRYFFPTHYEINEKQVAMHFFAMKRIYTWENVRRYIVFQDGIVVSPFSKPSRLETFRQLYLKYRPEQKDEVVRYFEKTYKTFHNDRRRKKTREIT